MLSPGLSCLVVELADVVDLEVLRVPMVDGFSVGLQLMEEA